jgi:cystathionine gamma-synthase
MSAPGLATRAVRAGIDCDSAHGAVVPPLVLSSNFSFEGFGRKRRYDYTRSGNPTRDQFACALAELEGGAGATVTSSGMSAIALVLQLLEPGDVLLAAHDCYGGSWRLFDALARKRHFQLRLVDTGDAAALEAALAECRPKLLWIETPSNPLLRITDLAHACAAGRAAGALVAVDNTFLSPALQNPIAFGADMVVHSTTKYINGHSDVVGGAVVAAEASLHELLGWWANAIGLTGSPFDSFLALRGLRTLDARLRVHQENAMLLAEAAAANPAVGAVHFPGLRSHPQYALACRQQRGFGAMLALELRGGLPAVRAFVDGLECFTLAESLGGVESLVAHPPTMTHASMSAEARADAGIGDGLLRLSVGIEAADDLLADLHSALARAGGELAQPASAEVASRAKYFSIGSGRWMP